MAQNDSQLHVNIPLTDYAIGFRPDESGFLWRSLLPEKVVPNTSNIIRQIDRANLMQVPDIRNGAQGYMSEVQFKMGASQTYACVDYAVEVVKDRRERSNADPILQYDQEMLFTGMNKVNLNLEKVNVRDTLRDTANYDSAHVVTLTSGSRWDDHNSPTSKPIEDIKTGVLRVKVQCGGAKRGTIFVVFHDYVWNKIQLHPGLLARAPVHPQGAGILTISAFEEILFGKPDDPNRVNGKVLTTSQFYNTALDPQAEDMRSFIGDDCLIIYAEPASQRAFGFGTSFMFSGITEGVEFMSQSGGIPIVVYSYPDPKRGVYGSDVDRIVGSVDFKILNPKGGYILKEVVDATNTAEYQSMLDN